MLYVWEYDRNRISSARQNYVFTLHTLQPLMRYLECTLHILDTEKEQDLNTISWFRVRLRYLLEQSNHGISSGAVLVQQSDPS